MANNVFSGPKGNGMEVRIRLSGGSRNHLSTDGKRFSFTTMLPSGTTVHELLKRFGLSHGTLVVVVVNDASDSTEYVLKDRDEIDILCFSEEIEASRKGLAACGRRD